MLTSVWTNRSVRRLNDRSFKLGLSLLVSENFKGPFYYNPSSWDALNQRYIKFRPYVSKYKCIHHKLSVADVLRFLMIYPTSFIDLFISNDIQYCLLIDWYPIISNVIYWLLDIQWYPISFIDSLIPSNVQHHLLVSNDIQHHL